MRCIYRVDPTGLCEAVPFPSHSHLMQLADAHGLDHILYIPPDGNDHDFVVYLSKKVGS